MIPKVFSLLHRDINRDIKTNRIFNYGKDGMVLNFTLDVGNEKGLRAFLDLLVAASEDVRRMIEKKPWQE